MTKRGANCPAKIKHDAIAEALLEVRFDTATMLELLLGRIIDQDFLKGFSHRHLPAYDLPQAVRLWSPEARYAPVIELTDNSSKVAVRIGHQTLSFHRQAPYVGWKTFKEELERIVRCLFAAAPDLTVSRLGLRYINALIPAVHNINSITDLDLKIIISGEQLTRSANLNYTSQVGGQSRATVRIATDDLVQGVVPPGANIIVDVDVYTEDGYSTSTVNDVINWIEFAHTTEKDEFFHIFRHETIEQWREE